MSSHYLLSIFPRRDEKSESTFAELHILTSRVFPLLSHFVGHLYPLGLAENHHHTLAIRTAVGLFKAPQNLHHPCFPLPTRSPSCYRMDRCSAGLRRFFQPAGPPAGRPHRCLLRSLGRRPPARRAHAAAHGLCCAAGGVRRVVPRL